MAGTGGKACKPQKNGIDNVWHLWTGFTGHISLTRASRVAFLRFLNSICWLKLLLSCHHALIRSSSSLLSSDFLLPPSRLPVQTPFATIPCLTDNCEICVDHRRDMKSYRYHFFLASCLQRFDILGLIPLPFSVFRPLKRRGCLARLGVLQRWFCISATLHRA